jgi:hypothetical protein
MWLLRFRDAAGQECKRKATTNQILVRLRDGRLPPGTEARRPNQPAFQPLARIAEFRSVRPKPKRPAAPPPAKKGDVVPVHKTNGKPPSPPNRRGLWLGVAGGVVLVVMILAALLKFLL